MVLEVRLSMLLRLRLHLLKLLLRMKLLMVKLDQLKRQLNNISYFIISLYLLYLI